MVLDLKADGSVHGSFYDSIIEGGRWKEDRGRTAVEYLSDTYRADRPKVF